MTRFFFGVLILLVPGTVVAANDLPGYVRITVEYTSMFPGKLQVLDNVCRESRNVECAKASIKVQSEACRRQPQSPSQSDDCKEARALLETSFCMEGLVYEGRVSGGAKIDVQLCVSEGGFGNMSVRNLNNGGVWTRYDLLSTGQVVAFP